MKSRVEQLDGLRGIFSVLVIAHHHNAFKSSIFYDNFFVINSSLFVDFFFVLSGFVIAINYNDRIHTSSDFLQFLKKRFIRLYPLLFFTEIIFLISNLLGDHSSLKNVSTSSYSYYFRTVVDTITFMGSTPVFGGWIGLNYPAWSISAEMISYIIFGLVVLLVPRYKYPAFALLILLSVIFIFGYGDYMLAYDYGFIRGLLCFCVGIFTFQIHSRKQYHLSWAEIPFLVLLVTMMYFTHHWELNLWRLVFPVIFSAGIIIFANSLGPVTRMLSSRPFQYLGKISYSIYLNHAIVLILINILLFRYLKLPTSETMIFLSLITSIALTIFYSNFTYELIEKKFGNYLRKRWN
ncbi:hypothetical protein DYBT9275_03377 [Dyadobacter sp. CECT 9275]|uniref:Acyltransferase 3 domain-containing protein n=1 Tax=Dyadobacter helix TaxID=2822344 RepID=A0A916JDV4_9BACT|nr:acyltransferase [Dyadobacter sp. CECT 9275]CAG5004471.1 hypothetical protein DYBT9275_03377 [Dyadobacter sp. CECT 9275]